MAKNYHSELRNRPDLAIIAELVEPGFRVLDLGCGDGSFLKMLKNEHGAEVLGMEIDPDFSPKASPTAFRSSRATLMTSWISPRTIRSTS